MNYPAYPTYKESGVAWLGAVPEHWEVWKVSHGFTSVGSGTTPPADNDLWYGGNILWVTTSELRENLIATTSKKVSREAVSVFSALKVFPKGSLAIAMYGATIGRLGILDSPATTNQACCVLSGEKALSIKFMFFWFQAYRSQIILLGSGGGQPNISQDKIRSIRVACPDIIEQTAIADFLDRETGRIDKLIEKKRQLIALLKEKRSALISRTVTRGLPTEAARDFGLEHHTRFKDSGVEWLGEVPDGWEVMALKWKIRTKSGDGIIASEVSPEKNENAKIPVIGGNGVMGYCNKANTLNPVIVVGRVGALCGNIHEVFNPAWVTDNALIVSFQQNEYHAEYLAALLRTRNLNDIADKTAQPLITGARVRAELFPIPPISEQTSIATYLDRETAKIEKLTAKVEQAIERLQEYRTALITSAVTGKIDVRYAVDSAGSLGLAAEEVGTYG